MRKILILGLLFLFGCGGGNGDGGNSGVVCGNGVCEQGETVSSCPSDCQNQSQDQPPTVEITSPQNSATVSGTITISVTAQDDLGISLVSIYVNSDHLVDLDPNPDGIYETQWNSQGGIEDQENEIKAIAYDSAHQPATDTVKVIVDNIPPGPFCGDSSCNGSENCASCPEDCGECPAVASVEISVVYASYGSNLYDASSKTLFVPKGDQRETNYYRIQAVAKDSSGVEIPGVTFSWSVTDPTIAQINCQDQECSLIEVETLKDFFDIAQAGEPYTEIYASAQGITSNVINIVSIICADYDKDYPTKTWEWYINGNGPTGYCDINQVGRFVEWTGIGCPYQGYGNANYTGTINGKDINFTRNTDPPRDCSGSFEFYFNNFRMLGNCGLDEFGAYEAPSAP